jgi:hypothetical protein
MNIRKTYITAVIITALVIATATTTAFPSATIFATPLLTPQEQVGNNTTTNATTSTAGPILTAIYITKHGTNSYAISGEMSSVGSFHTAYAVVGERSAIRSAENLIISTIVTDYSASPTIGYVTVGNTTTTAAANATLPNPFASPQEIAEKITNELRRVISEAENNTSQGQHVEIKCGFGMTLEEIRCHYIPLLGTGQG